MLSVDEFEQLLRRAARFIPQGTVADPLEALVQKVVQHPAYSESRLLVRLLAALTFQQGEFRVAEAAVFDARTLAIIVRLLDMRSTGTVSDSQLRLAALATASAELAGET